MHCIFLPIIFSIFVQYTSVIFIAAGHFSAVHYNQHIALWWRAPFLQKVWMAATETAYQWHAFPKQQKFQMVLPCTETDKHSVPVKTESGMVNDKSIYGQECLTKLRNLRWNMLRLAFWGHVGISCSSRVRLQCCSHREFSVLNIPCAPIISHFKLIVAVPVE